MADTDFPKRGASGQFAKATDRDVTDARARTGVTQSRGIPSRDLTAKQAVARARHEQFKAAFDPNAPREDEPRKPRIVLTEGAIFPKEWLHESTTVDNDNGGDHQQLSVGDKVMLTDDEFYRHRSRGVALRDADERDAA